MRECRSICNCNYQCFLIMEEIRLSEKDILSVDVQSYENFEQENIPQTVYISRKEFKRKVTDQRSARN